MISAAGAAAWVALTTSVIKFGETVKTIKLAAHGTKVAGKKVARTVKDATRKDKH